MDDRQIEQIAVDELDMVAGGGPTECFPDWDDFYKVPDPIEW